MEVSALVDTMGEAVLVFASSDGRGVLDPPDSDYEACAHAVIVCALAHGPRCTRSYVVAESRVCEPGKPALDTTLPGVTVAADGSVRAGGAILRIK